MGKRSVAADSLANRVKQHAVESRFKRLKPNQRVTSVNDIPLRIITQIYSSTQDKRAPGQCASSIKLYKKRAWEWLSKTWNTSEDNATSDIQLGKLLLSKVPIVDWKRLGIDFVSKVVSQSVESGNTLPRVETEFLVPVNLLIEQPDNTPPIVDGENSTNDDGSESASIADASDSNDGNVENAVIENSPLFEDSDDEAPVFDYEEENVEDLQVGDSDNGDDDDIVGDVPTTYEQFEEGIPKEWTGYDDIFGDVHMTFEEFEQGIPEHLRMNWAQIFKKFATHPGCRVSQEAWTSMLRDIQNHKPTLTENDLKKLPKTGRGIDYLKKAYSKHILFRDLSEYDADADEFAYTDFSQDFDRWHHDVVVPDPMDESDEVDDGEDNDDSEMEEEPINYMPSEEVLADDECSDRETDRSEGAVFEKDVLIDMEKDDVDADGWNEQGMCYFGIENVLMGRNPGMLDIRGYENALKAVATLQPDSLSEEIVDKLWDANKLTGPKGGQKPPTGGRKTEPTFVLDLFIDGVAIFKSSSKSSCTPIMGRVIRVNGTDGTNLPSRRSKPFMIGLYHGRGKPSRRAFFSDLCKELRFLHPDTVIDKDKYHRSITVVIRAIIGDAIERCWIRGCKQCTGYYSCERCHIKGEIIPTQVATGEVDEEGEPLYKTVRKGAVKFVTPERPPKARSDACWADYLQAEPGEKEGMSHRTEYSPLTEIPGFGPVTGFPLEEMHLVDGGAVKDTLVVVLNLNPEADNKWFEEQKKRKWAAQSNPAKRQRKMIQTVNNISRVRQGKWNHRIRKLRKGCTPFEFPRKCRGLRDFTHWKMSETRQFLMYYMVPLMKMDPSFDPVKQALVLKLILAYSKITGNILERPCDDDIDESRRNFKAFFKGMSELSPEWCTYKCHAMCFHLVDDAINFRCRTSALSSYPYENEVRFVSRWKFNGRNVPKQCANRFLLKHYNRNLTAEDDESFVEYMDKVKRNGYSLMFPPLFVHHFDAVKEIVKCESVTITTKFPNNIVRVPKFFTGCGGRAVTRNLCAVQSIFMDRETSKLKIAVKGFTTVANVFSKPYQSSKIGAYHCKDGLLENIEVFDFADIDCKFFPFALRMGLPFDCQSVDDDGEGGEQQWVMMKIQHSDLF